MQPDDYTPSDARLKRGVGRPKESPFCDAEREADFILRGKAMVASYFRPGLVSERKDFVFAPGKAMSKTLFWSLIYLYYKHSRLINDNLQGMHNLIVLHFGPKVVSDRTSLVSSVRMLENLRVPTEYTYERKNSPDAKAYCKNHSYYKYVVERWEEVLG